MTPRISVIMAARNAAETVREAIESVVQQTMDAWELIVVDDGSNDATLAEIQSVDDHRIQVVRNGRPMGAAASRNLAVERSLGEYIAVMDADDRCRPDRLALESQFLDRRANVSVVSGQIAGFGSWGGPSVLWTYPTDVEQIRRELHRGRMPIAHPAAMFRRKDFLAVGGYDERCPRAEDLALIIRLSHLGVANLPDIVLDYRMRRRVSLLYVFREAWYARIAREQNAPGGGRSTRDGLKALRRIPGVFLEGTKSWVGRRTLEMRWRQSKQEVSDGKG
ncbi:MULTISPECIES: glycosyltransferase family 2 protein [unclassified Blastococcus]